MSILTTNGVLHDDGTLVNNNYPSQRGIFGYGWIGGYVYASSLSLTNQINNVTGGVSTDITGVGTRRVGPAAASFGGSRAIVGYGDYVSGYGSVVSLTNRISELGLVLDEVTGVGTARYRLAASGYGGDKAIFGYGNQGGVEYGYYNMFNLVSNVGIVASDTTTSSISRDGLGAASYGTDKAIFGYGEIRDTTTSITTLITNTGSIGSDVTGVGSNRGDLSAGCYGGDKAIFGYGVPVTPTNVTNLVSNIGVVSSDVTGVGTSRVMLMGASYG